MIGNRQKDASSARQVVVVIFGVQRWADHDDDETKRMIYFALPLHVLNFYPKVDWYKLGHSSKPSFVH